MDPAAAGVKGQWAASLTTTTSSISRGQVGDLVDFLEHGEDLAADLLRRHVWSLPAHARLDPADHLLDLQGRGGPPGERLADPGRELLAVEGLGGAVALRDDEPHLLDPLEGREPASTGCALATPTDGAATVGRTRVDHAVVVGLAPRAAHGYGPQDVVAARTVPAAGWVVNRQAGMTRTCPGTSEPASTRFASAIA